MTDLKTLDMELTTAGRARLVRPVDEWIFVGRQEGPDEDGDRRGHWRRARPFAVALSDASGHLRLEPFLTLQRIKPQFISGAYAEHKKQAEIAGVPTAQTLRWPDEIFASGSPGPGLDGAGALPGLTWSEAELLCRLAGGRLASETEAELLARLAPRQFDWSLPAWTSTPYSRFSYDWCAYDLRRKRWFAAEDRKLPDNPRTNPAYSVFQWYPERGSIRRRRGLSLPEGSAPAQSGAGGPGAFSFAAACLLFDPEKGQ